MSFQKKKRKKRALVQKPTPGNPSYLGTVLPEFSISDNSDHYFCSHSQFIEHFYPPCAAWLFGALIYLKKGVLSVYYVRGLCEADVWGRGHREEQDSTSLVENAAFGDADMHTNNIKNNPVCCLQTRELQDFKQNPNIRCSSSVPFCGYQKSSPT